MADESSHICVELLRSGDLILSTTDGIVSNAIRSGTGSTFSHASIYFRDGVIIESNDDGVRPRRFYICGVDTQGRLVGLPYENWAGCKILRFDRHSPESSCAFR